MQGVADDQHSRVRGRRRRSRRPRGPRRLLRQRQSIGLPARNTEGDALGEARRRTAPTPSLRTDQAHRSRAHPRRHSCTGSPVPSAPVTLPGPVAIPVVFDVNVLVSAAGGGNSPFRSWPSPPPTSGNPAADSLGVIVDAAEFGLWLSPHILEQTQRVLLDILKWEPRQAQTFARVVQDAAHHSGGGVTDPPHAVGDCPDWEDNFIFDLVSDVGALILVSADTDLTSMSPWRGVPILTPT